MLHLKAPLVPKSEEERLQHIVRMLFFHDVYNCIALVLVNLSLIVFSAQGGGKGGFTDYTLVSVIQTKQHGTSPQQE